MAGGAEQRQVVGQPRQCPALFAFFEHPQHLLGARRHALGQAGELGDMDPVGAVGGAGADLVQKDDVVLPLLDPHRVAGEQGELGGECRQLVVMRRKEGAAAVDLVQVLEGRPRDREAVEGRRTAPDLVQDDQAPGRRLIEDRRGLDHLDHEGRTPARQVVGRADA